MFKILKELHEVFELFFSGSYHASTLSNPVKMEVRKNKAIEPDDSMSEAQLNLIVELKAREICEKLKGTDKYSIEVKALDSLLDETRMYQTKPQIKRIHSILNYVGSGKSVLDCGGGSGHIASLLKQAGNDVTVLDHSEVQLLRAKWLRKLKTVLGSVYNLPFFDNTFDVVILADILDQSEEMSLIMFQAERVCKPGGQIIVTTPVNKSLSVTLITDDAKENNSIVLSIKRTKDV